MDSVLCNHRLSPLRSFFLFLSTCFLFVPLQPAYAEAFSVPASLQLLAIDVTEPKINLMHHALVVEGSTDFNTNQFPTITIDNARKTTRTVEGFGYTSKAYWFLLALQNPTSTPLTRLLFIEPTWIDHIRTILVSPDGSRIEQQGGDLRPFSHRAVDHRQINLEIIIPPGASHMWVQTKTKGSFLVGMTLWEGSTFFNNETYQSLHLGLVYFIIIAMLLYNFTMFFSLRESIFAIYVLYLIVFLIMHGAYSGILFPFLWPTSPKWGDWSISIFIYLLQFVGIFLAVRFLDLSWRIPKLYRIVKIYASLLIFTFFAAAIFYGYRLHIISALVSAIFYAIFLVIIALISLRSGNLTARYYLYATVTGLVGISLTSITILGLIPFTFITYRAFDYGMVVEAVLISFALADRLRRGNLAKAQAA